MACEFQVTMFLAIVFALSECFLTGEMSSAASSSHCPGCASRSTVNMHDGEVRRFEFR